VNGTKTLLISAYLEHRVHSKETVAYCCLLCCQETLHVSEGVSSVHPDHFQFPYGTADIMCPVPSACQSPSYITVTSDKLEQRFMEVKNLEAKTDSFRYNFTVCLSTMFDFTNVLQLVQSLEMMRLLGVNRVVVYKTSCSPETQRLLDHYTQQGFLEVVSWTLSRHVNVSRGWLPLHGPGDLHYMGQIPALNDCLYRYMYQTRYLALQDMDELILPQTVSSWSALLPLLEKEHRAKQCYMFQNNVFPITAALPPPGPAAAPPADPWGKVSGINILKHLHHEPVIKETEFSNFKIIVSPRAIFSTSVHGVLSPQNVCAWVDRNVARMYHTRDPRQPELTADQLIYDGRLLNYSAALLPAVTTALRQSRLLPEDDTHQ
uniref:Glycosyltransferase family 92 protein n=1 Tax=Salarias fasciatus TaxID=181472 RepID=A0A672H6E0_SALFA